MMNFNIFRKEKVDETSFRQIYLIFFHIDLSVAFAPSKTLNHLLYN